MERIRMIGLGKSFGVRQVFSNVSFEIKEGDRIALVGPNGAGKSTLLKCILGIEELDEGQVVMSPVASIGYLQQDTYFQVTRHNGFGRIMRELDRLTKRPYKLTYRRLELSRWMLMRLLVFTTRSP